MYSFGKTVMIKYNCEREGMNNMGKRYTIISVSLTLLACLLIISLSGVIGKTGVLAGKGNKIVKYEKARIINVKAETLNNDSVIKNLKVGKQELEVEILSGEYAKQKFIINNAMSRIYNVNAKTDMEVIASIYISNGQISDVSLYSYKRDKVIYVLIAVFFLVVLIIGKTKGVQSVVALIFTGIMIIYFMLPLLFRGISPILGAIITAIIIVIVTHLLITGISKKSFSAMIGTILGVIIAGIISYIAGKAAHISGLTMDNIENLIVVAENSSFKIDGLMFASILIAALGAVMDIGMSIASSIFEMNSINPNLSKKQLFNSGMNVGKDVIGTMSNTLILAFVGGSLSMIILIMASSMQYTQMINLDVLCIQIIQGLSGSIGIVLTVPITAVISVWAINLDFNLKVSSNRKVKKTKRSL
jgi:uncharacterized membrane protein